MNAFGVSLIVILIIFCLFKPKYTIVFLFILSLFQGSVVYNGSSFSIITYYVGLLVFIFFNLKYLWKLKFNSNILLIASIFVFSTLQTIISQKLLFFELPVANTQVMSVTPEIKLLDLNSSSIGQMCYLFLNLLAFLLATKVAERKQNNANGNTFNANVLSLIIFSANFFGFLQKIFPLNGNEVLNQTIFANENILMHCSKTYGDRVCSTFTEPSTYAPFLLFSLGYFVYLFLRSKRFPKYFYALSIIICFANLYFVFSLSAIALSFISFIFYLIFFVNYKIVSIGRLVSALSIVILSLTLSIFFSPIDYFSESLASKSTGESLDVRVFADSVAINNFASSYGLGLGLGSTRGSSALTTLLGNLGIIGLFLFSLLFAYFFRQKIPSGYSILLKYALAICLSGMIFSIPDLSYTYLWGLLILFYYYSIVDTNGLNQKKTRLDYV